MEVLLLVVYESGSPVELLERELGGRGICGMGGVFLVRQWVVGVFVYRGCVELFQDALHNRNNVGWCKP